MKKKLFSAILCLAICQIIKAQSSFIPSVGVNFSKVLLNQNPANVSSSAPSSGVYFGGSLIYACRAPFDFQLGVQYSQKGQRAFIPSDPSFSHKERIHYLDFMPSIEYKVGKTKHLGFSGGLNLGINCLEQFKFPNNPWESLVFQTMKRLDLGFLVGTKIYFKKIVVGFSYNQSILNASSIIFTDEFGTPLSSSSVYNQNFQVGLGYIINYKNN